MLEARGQLWFGVQGPMSGKAWVDPPGLLSEAGAVVGFSSSTEKAFWRPMLSSSV